MLCFSGIGYSVSVEKTVISKLRPGRQGGGVLFGQVVCLRSSFMVKVTAHCLFRDNLLEVVRSEQARGRSLLGLYFCGDQLSEDLAPEHLEMIQDFRQERFEPLLCLYFKQFGGYLNGVCFASDREGEATRIMTTGWTRAK